MGKIAILLAAMAFLCFGCSCKSTIERADLVAVEAREEYARLHPDGIFNEFIRNGEITKGMSVHEVIASWGMPNVYAVAKGSPEERWIYYVRDRESLSLLIYSLRFQDDTLKVWDIDIKRSTGHRIASKFDFFRENEPPPSDPSSKRRK